MKLAIIGASIGQIEVCKKAKEIPNLETYCFAWEKGAVCKDLVDHFVPISIMEKDAIADRCKALKIDGVVSNASDKTSLTTAYVAEKLGLHTTPYSQLLKIKDKNWVRQQTNNILGLTSIRFEKVNFQRIKEKIFYPCVIKPITGAAKVGVNFLNSENDFNTLQIDEALKESDFLIEEYIKGREVSVESLSYEGQHNVIQITDKISTGAPHFAELGHNQPADLPQHISEQICKLIPEILTAVNFTNGASHIELKISPDNRIYLIEINPRGGGDQISNRLVALSTDCDYIKELINISIGSYTYKPTTNTAFCGIRFLCEQTKHLLHYAINAKDYPEIIEYKYDGTPLIEQRTNYERNGYILFVSKDKKTKIE